MLPVESPFKTYTGLDGKPLDNGYVYFGLPNQDAVAHPITVYWDAAGTIPAAQPLRTVSGYIMNAGAPANVFCDGAYSELVNDSKGRQVFYVQTSESFSIATLVLGFAKSAGSSLIGFIQAGAGAIMRTVQDKLRETVSVKDFGATGDGVTNDTDAFQKACAVINAAGGGCLVIPPGTYIVGKQTFAAGAGKGYSYQAADIIYIHDCTKPVVIRCLGAKLKLASGLKFGSFDPITGAAYVPALPFTDLNYAAAVGDIINLKNNASIEIDPIEVDGNAAGVMLGGQWGDAGYQLAGSGINLVGNQQAIVRNPYAHHCCLDGIYVGYNGLTETSPIYPHTIISPRCEYNGRQGMSWVGGTNLQVLGGTLSYTGKNGYVASMPKCGLDIEPSASICKNGTFVGVEFIDNAGGNPGSWANRPDIRFINCHFVGVTTYSWYGAGFCDGCTFEGEPNIEAGSRMTKCSFSMRPKSTAALYGNFAASAGNLVGVAMLDACNIDSGAKGVLYAHDPATTWLQLHDCTLDGTTQTNNAELASAIFTGLTRLVGAGMIGNVNNAYTNGLGVFQGTTYDGTSYYSVMGPFKKTQFYSPDRTLSALEVYCPSSFGGRSPIGGIDFSANNLAATPAKVAYSRVSGGISDNTPGTEGGALVFGIRSAGTMSNLYTMIPGQFYPVPDNTQQLGGPANRWTQLYAASGTINTSDARAKQQVQDIEPAALRAFARIGLKQFKFNDAVESKGAGARWHFGAIAQQVKEAFEAEGLDGFAYGVLCYDEWPEQAEVRDEEGTIVTPYQAAGNRYGVRYDELAVLGMAYMMSKLDA